MDTGLGFATAAALPMRSFCWGALLSTESLTFCGFFVLGDTTAPFTESDTVPSSCEVACGGLCLLLRWFTRFCCISRGISVGVGWLLPVVPAVGGKNELVGLSLIHI